MSAILSQRVGDPNEILISHNLIRSFYLVPEQLKPGTDRKYEDNESFWLDAASEKLIADRVVTLDNFHVFEWIPRNPGLYHTPQARDLRRYAEHEIREFEEKAYKDFVNTADAPPDHAGRFRKATSTRRDSVQLIYTPQGKSLMLRGGIGCIRLCPVERKTGGQWWFMSATSTNAPDEGIPLLVSNTMYQAIIDDIRSDGCARRIVIGRTRFVSKELDVLYGQPYGMPRLYVEVEEFRKSAMRPEAGEVSVAASFVSSYQGSPGIYASYVTFDPGFAGARDSATDWLKDEYVQRFYNGTVLTDFDQQRPTIGHALFGLEQIMASRDLAGPIDKLRQTFGYFDWKMLEEKSIKLEGDNVMVKNIISGERHQVIQSFGDNSPISVSTRVELPQDLDALAAQLQALRKKLGEGTPTATDAVAAGIVAEGEVAATSGDAVGIRNALAKLKPYAASVLRAAKDIGVEVATSAIKACLGLP